MSAVDAVVQDRVDRRLYINMVFTPSVIQNEVKLNECANISNIELEPYIAIEVSNWAGGGYSQGNGVYMYKETTWQTLLGQSNGTIFNLNFSNAITSGGPNNPTCSNTVGSYNTPIFAADRAAAEALLESICYTCPGQGGGANQWGVVDWTNQTDASIDLGSLRFQVT